MKVVIINGGPCAGTDLFVTFCASVLGTDRIKNYSTIDYVKAVAATLGWDGTKTDKNRKFLSELKALLTEWDDIPYRQTRCVIQDFSHHLEQIGEDGVIFIHCREPHEIQRFKDEFNAITLLVRLEQSENVQWSNNSDCGVYDYEYDYTIMNNGTLSELRAKAEEFVHNYLGF